MKLASVQTFLMLVIGTSVSFAQPTIASVVDPYTGSTRLSPGGQGTITGTSLGINPQVTVGGIAAFNVVPPQQGSQMKIQIPWNAPLGSTIPVVVTTGDGASAPFNIALTQYAPVLINTTSGALTSPRHQSSGVAVTASTPAVAGESVIVYAIGLGPVTTPVSTGALPQASLDNTITSPTVSFNGNTVAGATAFLGAGQGFFGANYSGPMTGSKDVLVGVYQVTFTLPSGTPSGSYPVKVSIGGATSNSPMLSVGTAPTGPVISAMVGETGKTILCPGDIAIISGLNLGQNPTVTVGGKTAYNVNPPNGGNQMTVEIPVDAALGAVGVALTPESGDSSPAFSVTLTQYAPALLYGGGGGPFPPLHLSQYGNTLVNASAPAAPGETIAMLVYGLGPTNPVVSTGTPAPALPQINTVIAPTVYMADQSVSATAFLDVNEIGVYEVAFVVPQNLTTGAYGVWVSVGGLGTGLVDLQVYSGPIISNVANAASNLSIALPNGGLAQGSIFIVQGTGLGPASITFASSPFASDTLSGTSVAVDIGGRTVNAPMYYTSATQVAALLPSNTPTGTGMVTVTYNGTMGSGVRVPIVKNNLGIFTIDSTGQGPAIVTYADYSLVSAATTSNCGGPDTACGAANPGDTLILWATGLGPVTGGDTVPSALGQPIAAPLTVWLGGVQAPVSFQGRGCCYGEDQIIFAVPDNVPTGCAVPLVIQIDDEISNSTVMPVATGSRNCTPVNPALAASSVEQTAMAGTVSFGSIKLRHLLITGSFFGDDAKFQFSEINAFNPGTQPFFASWIDDLPLGTCLVFPNLTGNGLTLPVSSSVPLDAGHIFNVEGPNGGVQVKGTPGQFDDTLSSTGTFLVPGTFGVTSVGGTVIGPINNAKVTFPGAPTLTTPVSGNSVARTSGLTATWSGGSANAVQLTVEASTDNTSDSGAAAQCIASAQPGTFTIPPYVLLALPAGPYAGFDFQPAQVSAPFTATGLNLGLLQTYSDGTSFGFGSGSGSGSLALK